MAHLVTELSNNIITGINMPKPNRKILSITMPNDFFERLKYYVRSSGADSMQQIKMLEWTELQSTIIYEFDPNYPNDNIKKEGSLSLSKE